MTPWAYFYCSISILFAFALMTRGTTPATANHVLMAVTSLANLILFLDELRSPRD